jgi:hypothetical protein
MTEEPTHHHMVADTVQIKLEMPAVDTKVISPEELRAGAIVQPEPWMVLVPMYKEYWNRDIPAS